MKCDIMLCMSFCFNSYPRRIRNISEARVSMVRAGT
jgi:hypothetical protein